MIEDGAKWTNKDGPPSISLEERRAEPSSLLPDASLPLAGPSLPACFAREASAGGPARPPSRTRARTGSPVKNVLPPIESQKLRETPRTTLLFRVAMDEEVKEWVTVN